MCGIAGIIQRHPSFTAAHITKMMGALAHRGPDGERYWINETQQVLFGHRRLSIIDPGEAAAQPMHYLDRYTIIYNGEIYNYKELKKELEAEGYRFTTASDTEVILAAFDHYEEDCVDHFDGMFAFAIWDKKERELFAARDRFGEKPFYYFRQPGVLIFASEMKALWAAGIPREANLKMLFNFITIGYTDNPEQPDETFFSGIHRLPPASHLFYQPEEDELEIEKYWRVDTKNIDHSISDSDAIEKFSELLSGSVYRRLRSDVPVGTSLSGGLDSSAIVSVIDQLQVPEATRPRHAFTAVFPGFEKDESAFSKQVADKFHLQQHLVSLSPEALTSDWKAFAWQQEEPVGSASAYVQYKVFETARQEGIKVLLDGQGADEILAGYRKYYKWYWQELFRGRRLLRSGEIKAARQRGVTENFGIKNIVAALFPDIASVVLERQYLANALRHPHLTRDFIHLQSQEAYYATPALADLNGALHFNTFEHGLEELLRYADRNSMAHGREVRLPFLYHGLVEFLFSLPPEFKIRKGWSKWLLRESMNGRLPDNITWRKDKVGFEPPQLQWMQSPLVQEMIHEARKILVRENIVSPSILKQPVQPHSAHAADSDDWKFLSAAELFQS